MARTVSTLISLTAAFSFSMIVTFGVLHFAGKAPLAIVDKLVKQLPIETTAWTGLQPPDPVVIGTWPPRKGEQYPDLILSDQNGDTVQLSDLAGKVILLELAAVPCKGCQAFAGGKEYGGFGGVSVQPGLESIHHYAARFAGIDLGNDDVVYVQLLLYGNSMGSPTQEEVAGWADHFQMQRTDNTIVLRGDPSMLGIETYERIPGFHLIDKKFELAFDSSGHHPEDNLFEDLLPALGQMVNSGR